MDMDNYEGALEGEKIYIYDEEKGYSRRLVAPTSKRRNGLFPETVAK